MLLKQRDEQRQYLVQYRRWNAFKPAGVPGPEINGTRLVAANHSDGSRSSTSK